jgi:hypothetical protein
MRRTKSVLAAAVVMVALLAAFATPAMANKGVDDQNFGFNSSNNGCGSFNCGFNSSNNGCGGFNCGFNGCGGFNCGFNSFSNSDLNSPCFPFCNNFGFNTFNGF